MANFVLPLVMIAQMVFSIRIAGEAALWTLPTCPGLTIRLRRIAWPILFQGPQSPDTETFCCAVFEHGAGADDGRRDEIGSEEVASSAVTALMTMATACILATWMVLRWQICKHAQNRLAGNRMRLSVF